METFFNIAWLLVCYIFMFWSGYQIAEGFEKESKFQIAFNLTLFAVWTSIMFDHVYLSQFLLVKLT